MYDSEEVRMQAIICKYRHLIIILLIKKSTLRPLKSTCHSLDLKTFQTWVKYNLALYENIIRVHTSGIHLFTGNNLKI